MREMVLNDASLQVVNLNEFANWVMDIVEGMITLSKSNVVENQLRLSKGLHEISCLPEQSLYGSLFEIIQDGKYRDACLYFIRLTQKTPLLTG